MQNAQNQQWPADWLPNLPPYIPTALQPIVRWDAATCSNVPVTQAWVDEVCATLTEALKNIAYLTANPVVVPDAKSEQDRMWAAVVAVS